MRILERMSDCSMSMRCLLVYEFLNSLYIGGMCRNFVCNKASQILSASLLSMLALLLQYRCTIATISSTV